MATEKVLTPPLSSTEVVEAVIDAIRIALRRDCHLAPGNAYGTFSAEIYGKIRLYDLGTEYVVDLKAKSNIGHQTEGGEETDLEVRLDEKPPNTVRVSSGQPVPVQVRNSQGKNEVRYVKYGRDRAKGA